jgi:hypothetical protein
VIWIATTVSSFLLGLVLVLFAPAAADTVARTAIERIGPSLGWGAAAFVGIPLVALLAGVTLVGLPLGIGVLLALGLIYWLGYTAAAVSLGRRLVRSPTHRVPSFLAGWGVLRAVALVPVLGGFVWLAATLWGLGALLVAARTAGRGTERPVQAPAGAIPPPPPPPVGTMP